MGLSLLSASCTAAVFTRLLLHPLDTLRIKTQLGKRMIMKDAYKGLGIALLFSVPGLSAYLLTYDYSKELISKMYDGKETWATHGAAAVCAEVVSGVFWTPMEIIKAKQQSGAYPASTWQLVQSIFKEKGVLGFFRGYIIQLYVFVPYTVSDTRV